MMTLRNSSSSALRPRPSPRAATAALRLPAVMAALVWAFSGCTTVGPNFEPPVVDAPARWSDRHGGAAALAAPADAASAFPSDRWAVFGDAELTRLQALAARSSPDVQTAALRVLQSRTQEATVAAQRGVQVGAKAAVARQRQSEFGSASRLVNAIGGPNAPQLLKALSAPFTLYDAGFDASWEPDLWGRVLRSQELAGAATEAQAAALGGVQLSVKAEVARAYFALRVAQRQRALTNEQLDAAEEMAGLIEAQVGTGLSDESALMRQKAQIAAVQSQQPALLAQEAQAMNRLTLLCGAEPGTLNEELAATRMEVGEPTLPDLRLGLPADLVRRRPDVVAAEAQLHAATAAIGIAVADLYPRITLGASFGLESVGSGKFGDWGSRQWSLGPSLSLPLFDAGRRRSTITLRELQQQEAAVAFQQTVLKAWHEVDDAISAYVAESQRSDRLRDRLRSTADDAMLAQARYAQGLTSYMPVLGTRASEIEVRRELSDSRARLQTALAALYKALGTEPP